jgi:hypothetical protein
MPRHNTAADKELSEDLAQELWAVDKVWVCCCSHVLPLSPLYDGPYTVLQRSLRQFKLQMGDREDNTSTSLLKPFTSSTATSTGAPLTRGQPRWDTPNSLAPTKGVCFNLMPAPLCAAADSGTIFPSMPTRFFACPEEASSSCYQQRNRGPPALATGPHLLSC